MKKPATQQLIADTLGISRATVAEILGGRNAHRYNEKTREMVISTAKKMKYRPNRHAQVLGGGGSRVIGVIKSVSYHQRNVDLVLHLGEAIHERGYDVISGELFRSKEIGKVVDLLHDLKVEGLIIAHLHTNFGLELSVQRLLRTGVPCVAVGGDPTVGMPYFSIDFAAVGKEFVRYFRKAGYRKIFVIGREDWEQFAVQNAATARMISGFLHAALDEGYSREEIIIHNFKVPSTKPVQAPMVGAEVMDCLIRQYDLKNSVVVFESDIHATSAMLACHRHGISIPEQIGVVGLDGSDIGNVAWPPLTSLRLPVKEMAVAAVEHLFGAISDKKQRERTVLFPCKPVIRDSTRPILS